MQKRRTEKRRKLGRETTRLNREIEEVKAKGTRLLQEELGSANGFVREELARLEARRNELEDQLRRVEWELDSSGRTWAAPGTVTAQLARLNDMWDSLFPAEQERVVRLLVEDVVVCQDHLEVAIRPDGLCSVADELMHERGQDAASSTG
jgi:predicted nuclease with TOPRIM domain